MLKTGLAVLLVSALILATVSMVYAQSAGGQTDCEGWLSNPDGRAVNPSTLPTCVASLYDEIKTDQVPYIRLAADQMQQCLTCCAARLRSCGNAGNCNTLYQNCVANCNSHGETPSDWRCW